MLLHGRFAEAVDVLNRAVFFDPNNGLAHRNLGIACQKLGTADEAVASYQSALDVSPRDVVSHYRLGRLLIARGMTTEGERHLQASRSRPPHADERQWMTESESDDGS